MGQEVGVDQGCAVFDKALGDGAFTRAYATGEGDDEVAHLQSCPPSLVEALPAAACAGTAGALAGRVLRG